MSQSAKFLIAENPMAAYGVEYVLHTQKPRFLAKYTPDSPTSHFEVIDDIDGMAAYYSAGGKRSPEEVAAKIAGLMRRLGDWWVAYLHFEE